MPDLVLYDGECGLCQRSNRFILRRDRRDRFRFASLQGPLASAVLGRHGRSAAKLDTVFVIADYEGPNERLLCKASAVLHVLRTLGGPWAAAGVAGLLPAHWLDHAYDFVAARRQRWFRDSSKCPRLTADERAKFL